MKRTCLYAIMASVALSCAATTSPALAQPRTDQRGERRPGEDRQQASPNDHERQDGQAARNARRNWRDDRTGAHWDDSQHNGYYVGNTWRRGPPPAASAGRSNIRLGYHPWARGQRLGYYRTRYEEIDYHSVGRRHPRRGYHWVRDERGDALLVSIATGLIVDIIIHQSQSR